MNNWTASEIAFRCERLSVRMERLAQNFLRMEVLSVNGADAETVLALIRKSKIFLVWLLNFFGMTTLNQIED
jgi:hypothetical protein